MATIDAVRDAAVSTMDPVTLYRILALRSDVFVVEQDCVYLDLDGRDLDPDARQLWIESEGTVVATLRILFDDAHTARIGRVATARGMRGDGLAGRLITRAVELCGDREIVLHAQSYLEQWYARFGFVPDGRELLEDGIPHVPMRLGRERS